MRADGIAAWLNPEDVPHSGPDSNLPARGWSKLSSLLAGARDLAFSLAPLPTSL